MVDGETYALDMLWKHFESLNILPCTIVYERSAHKAVIFCRKETIKL
jgi:hypothetical protein